MEQEPKESFDPTEEARFEEARFRYGVISKIIQGEVPTGKVAQSVREVAGQEWIDWKGRKRRLTQRAIYYWIKLYRQKGFHGLMRRRRSDKGKLRAFSEETLKKLISIRDDQPDRSTPTVLHVLRLQQGNGAKVPWRSTVDRHLDRLGKSRRRMGTLS